VIVLNWMIDSDDRFFMRIALVFTIAYLVVSVLLYLTSVTTYDATVFSGLNNSWYRYAVTSMGRELGSLFPPPDLDFYFLFVAAAYRIPRVGWLVPPTINFVFGLILLGYTYRTTALLSDHRTAENALNILVFIPTVYVYAYHTSPDFLTVTAAMVSVYYLTRTIVHREYRSVAGFVVGLATVSALRTKLGVLLAGTYGVVMVVTLYRNYCEMRYKRIIPVVVPAIGLLLLMFVLSFLTPFGRIVESLVPSLNGFIQRNVAGQTGLSAVFAQLPPVLRSVAGVLPFLVMPFPPWVALASPSFWTIAHVIESLVVYLLFPFSVIGVKTLLHQRKLFTLPAILYTTVLILGLTTIYGGLVARFRIQAVPFLIVLAAIGFDYHRQYSRLIVVYLLGYPALAVFYLVLKLA
jgi:hypothetical protein